MGGIIAGQQAAAARATSEDTVTALHEAIGVISSVCDYAQSYDAQGFNAADTWLGHVLAHMPVALWTDDAALATWDMLRKYRGQLAAAGIGYDDLPRPAGADELEAGRRDRARQCAREHAQHWREQQYRQARTYLRCDGEGGKVTLAFPYNPDLVAACQAIPGRRYDGAAKANVFPFTSLPAVIKLADTHQIEVTAEVRAAAAAREPRGGAGIAAGGMHPGAEPADDDLAARWPAPNPRVARITSPPDRQGSHVVAESRAAERAGPAADTEVGGTTTSGRPAVPPDWRDQVLAAARQPWQPSPGQRRDPSPAVSPGRQASSVGIEPDV